MKSPFRIAVEALKPGQSASFPQSDHEARRLQQRLHARTSIRISVNKISGGVLITRLRGQRIFPCASLPQTLYLRREGPLLRLTFSDAAFFLSRSSARRLSTALLEAFQ
jgi:hypothetical protein